MSTLLILGSKPEPALPPAYSYEDVACANASGYSAARYQLPVPVYTVMSSWLASGIRSGEQSLQAMKNLHTGTLYFLDRRKVAQSLGSRLYTYIKTYKNKRIYRMTPFYLKQVLKPLQYTYDNFITLKEEKYDGLVKELCGYDAQVLAQMEKKKPSTGVVALALGMSQGKYSRYVISGFSFELTHAYARNPEIDERGTAVSGHADTDILVINRLYRRHGNIYTTEKTVHEQAGIPLFTTTPAATNAASDVS